MKITWTRAMATFTEPETHYASVEGSSKDWDGKVELKPGRIRAVARNVYKYFDTLNEGLRWVEEALQ